MKVDECGNTLEVISGNVKLKLKGFSTKDIGRIKGDTLYLKRKRLKHLHIKSMSYGFCEALIDLSEIEFITLEDEKGTYHFPKSLVKSGNYLFYKQKGYEKQLFVPLSDITRYKI